MGLPFCIRAWAANLNWVKVMAAKIVLGVNFAKTIQGLLQGAPGCSKFKLGQGDGSTDCPGCEFLLKPFKHGHMALKIVDMFPQPLLPWGAAQ